MVPVSWTLPTAHYIFLLATCFLLHRYVNWMGCVQLESSHSLTQLLSSCEVCKCCDQSGWWFTHALCTNWLEVLRNIVADMTWTVEAQGVWKSFYGAPVRWRSLLSNHLQSILHDEQIVRPLSLTVTTQVQAVVFTVESAKCLIPTFCSLSRLISVSPFTNLDFLWPLQSFNAPPWLLQFSNRRVRVEMCYWRAGQRERECDCSLDEVQQSSSPPSFPSFSSKNPVFVDIFLRYKFILRTRLVERVFFWCGIQTVLVSSRDISGISSQPVVVVSNPLLYMAM